MTHIDDLKRISDYRQQITEALETMSNMYQLKNAIKGSIDSGAGLDKHSANMFNKTINNLTYPYKLPEFQTISTETLEFRSSRLATARYVLEKVEATAKGGMHRFLLNMDTFAKFFEDIANSINRDFDIFTKTIDKVRKDIEHSDLSNMSDELKHTPKKFFYSNSREIIDQLETHVKVTSDLAMINNNVRKKLLPYIEIMTHHDVDDKDNIRKMLDEDKDFETILPGSNKTLDEGKVIKIISNTSSVKDMMVLHHYKLIDRDVDEHKKPKREKDPKVLLKILEILEQEFITNTSKNFKDNDNGLKALYNSNLFLNDRGKKLALVFIKMFDTNDIKMEDIDIWQYTTDNLFNLNYSMLSINHNFARKVLEYVKSCLKD